MISPAPSTGEDDTRSGCESEWLDKYIYLSIFLGKQSTLRGKAVISFISTLLGNIYYLYKRAKKIENNVKLSLGKVMDSHSEFPAVLSKP